MASPRTQFYHAAREIDGALRGIERCIRRAEGVGLVVGAAGSGKSLLLLKLAEQVRDDFDVALLTGASICTRRALWQSILAAIGEPYRGIDETELRIAIVERIRGLAAAGSGLAILVDEAHTLPTRLIEELRLLTNIPTPMPAVHIVLAGTTRLDEMLGAARLESLAQRVAVRGHLEPLDHGETVAYLETQVRAAGLEWDRLFAAGCDDAVYRVTEGVPRLINQVCDQALVAVAESDRRVTPADIAMAWREIQRLPAPPGLEAGGEAGGGGEFASGGEYATTGDEPPADLGGDGFGVIEFGADADVMEEGPAADAAADESARVGSAPVGSAADPWDGPDVELVFDSGSDPFESVFGHDQSAGDRCGGGPDDFSGCRHVASREGQSLGKLLATVARDDAGQGGRHSESAATRGEAAGEPGVRAADAADEIEVIDDSDMVVIEEDLYEPAGEAAPAVVSVRPSDYRSLFTRLRRSRG
jgi:type II secretory pathway predicted ATPase ExeA